MIELFPLLAAGSLEQWQWQLFFVAISLLGLGGYFLGYTIAVRRPPSGSRSLAGGLYGSGALASLAWYVMPFLPQPRLPGVADLASGAGDATVWLCAVAQLYGLIVGIRYFLFTWRSTLLNLSVTRRNVFAPERLLTEGVYGEVRHPMLAGDALAHLGIAMAAGGAITIALYPIYYAINEAFVTIQERMVLLPRFGDTYRAYASRVPRMMSRRLRFLFAIGAVLAFASLILCHR